MSDTKSGGGLTRSVQEKLAETNPIIIEIDTAIMGDRNISNITIAVIRNDLQFAVGNVFEASWEQVEDAVRYLYNRIPGFTLRKLQRTFKAPKVC